MNADVKGALNQLNKSYKAFVHNGHSMTKEAVKKVLEYAIAKGYEHTGQLKDAEIDHILTKGTTVEQWERYYVDSKAHDERCKREKLKKSDYGYIGNMPPDAEGERAYEVAYSNWDMMCSCDAPNKPGYYRANND